MTEYHSATCWDSQQVAEYLGVSVAATRQALSRAGIGAAMHYPAGRVRAIHRPGRWGQTPPPPRPQLVITRGLPGSGKTTWALEWLTQDRDSRARVSKDTLREMLDCLPMGSAAQEEMVTVMQRAAVAALLAVGRSVVCDDTSLPDRRIDEWRQLAEASGAELVVIDLRDVDVDECVRRDAARAAAGGRSVGESIIREMARRQDIVPRAQD